jgi:tRNA(Ile)-lysidine synthase
VVNGKTTLNLNTAHLKPGMRLAVGVSGGADSVSLLRALAQRAPELGLVLFVAHLHHGLRGAEADADLEFVRELAAQLNLPLHEAQVDTAAEAAAQPGKPAETIEEAARRLRYAWFRTLMRKGKADAVATAHTLDDQAETVLAKFLRGAWTEGFSGIHPVVEFPEGSSPGVIVRPLLATTRAEVETYLSALGQNWREDSTNRHLTFTRNRIRHELLPLLQTWNPRLSEHLAQMAELARDEEAWWHDEISRSSPGVILTGKPVRGGGRAAGEEVAIDLPRLAGFHPAIQRRILRHAAASLGFAPDFAGTETLRNLALHGKAGQRCELAAGLRAERTHRELRLTVLPENQTGAPQTPAPEEVTIPVPGEGESSGFGVRIRITRAEPPATDPGPALLRNWKPGDRVRLRHSAAPKKVKEVLERLKVSGAARARWPVLELNGRIVWMQGVVLEPEAGITITATEPESPATSYPVG